MKTAQTLVLLMKIFCFCQHVAHDDMLGVLGERYAPKAVTAQGSRVRTCLERVISFFTSFFK